MTNLKNLKQDFFIALQPIYNEGEVSNFFKWLAEDLLDLKTHDLLLESEVNLDSKKLDDFKKAQARLEAQEPIQYILGYAEFFGLRFRVNSSVLIPRPETEELVEWILEDQKSSKSQLSILDLGTGSGCIPIALAKHLPQAKLKALDISVEALKLAELNSEDNNTRIEYIQGDVLILKYLAEGIDIVVSNPPYVKFDEQAQMQDNVLKNEPHLALFVKDNDPLIFYRKIAELTSKLTKRPLVYVEINQYLAEETRQLFKSFGFEYVEIRKDFRGNHRMLKAY
ncbi:peptide chain release factor N(5)-glutamine methyltransferase [Psychroflexus gondwanensis]|jgi:release factor glutamine methyltransferase|uniref:peptide chain release factor N(5)-glutamine methyltransferase n=1 Tax=Psychroflexus gondwanensis ACAM 44 TaxID=1189619 RepID=N1WXD1_9FLAO|nr:peptide chain release factor N(5)-glutamine methyltransferase [Psychroflexus gondwanensis]EMY81857.1 N5-glutamine S-adenosyl-L-methionine-dependent methyltransferase [Psychroflexus gondwanensis ACAM 44]TXE19830.1 peptide chain release factor N(5)-glutamine methyltransferase [Psychroflexus gondwanensis]